MKKLWVITLCVMLVAGSTAWAQNKVTVVSQGPEHPFYGVAVKILTEAYAKVGYTLTMTQAPSARGHMMTQNGEADGDLFSDMNVFKEYPNLIQVPVAMGTDDLVVFTKTVDFKVDGWASLKPYSIGFLSGMSVVEVNMKGLKAEGVADPATLFNKLDKGRTDIVVLPRTLGMAMLKGVGIKGVKYLNPAVQQIPLYHFMSPKQKDLAAKLAVVLKDMEKAGRIKEINDQVEADMAK